jgi:hypothetical protein
MKSKKRKKEKKKQDGGSGVPGTKFRNGTRSAEKRREPSQKKNKEWRVHMMDLAKLRAT